MTTKGKKQKSKQIDGLSDKLSTKEQAAALIEEAKRCPTTKGKKPAQRAERKGPDLSPMINNNADFDLWAELYFAAYHFAAERPWKEWSEDLFAFPNPFGSTDCLCVITGEMGESIGLACYFEQSQYYATFSLPQWSREAVQDFSFGLNALMLSFCPWRELEAADRKLAKALPGDWQQLGLYPSFRSHRPGFMPHTLDRSEVHLARIAFQSVQMFMAIPPQQLGQGEYPVFKYDLATINSGDLAQGRAQWEAGRGAYRPAGELPELSCQRLLKQTELPRRENAAWEIDWFSSASAIAGGPEGRAYVGLIMLVADRDNGVVMGMDILVPGSAPTDTLSGNLAETMSGAGYRPRNIYYEKDVIGEYLGPILEKIGIRAEKKDRLLAIDSFRESLERNLEGRGGSFKGPYH